MTIIGHPIWNKLKGIFFEDKEHANQTKAAHKKKLKPFHWMIMMACLGLGAMILHSFFSIQNDLRPAQMMIGNANEEPSREVIGSNHSVQSTFEAYERIYENQLRDIISGIVGVGEVEVMVTVDSTEKLVVAVNKRTSQSVTNESDREGGSRQIEDHSIDEQIVIVRKNNNEEPVVLMKKKPEVRGVLVVAVGAEDMRIRAMITEAVQRSLNVPLNRISVQPKRN